MEENKINALMDMTVSKIRQLVDADTIIGKPISTPDGITVIPVSRMSFGIGTGGTTGSKGISFTGGNGAGVKVEPVGFFADVGTPGERDGMAAVAQKRLFVRGGFYEIYFLCIHSATFSSAGRSAFFST